MKIVVVGATGQIGYALVRVLAAMSHEVRVLVRRRDLQFPPSVEVCQATVFDEKAFAAALAGMEHAIYALGLPAQFTRDASIFDRVNVDLLGAWLRALGGCSVERLTYLSTYEVFSAVGGQVREDHQLVDPARLSPYFRSMRTALDLVHEAATVGGLMVTTIHPAAVFGGRNTGAGFTDYLHNVVHRRMWRVPFVFEGRFPLVHVESLAEGIAASLGHSGAFLISDGMTTLRELAEIADRHRGAYVPPVLPVSVARAGAAVMEPLAHLTGTRPLMARVQIEYITNGVEPVVERAPAVLGWQPLPLSEGVRRWRQAHDHPPTT